VIKKNSVKVFLDGVFASNGKIIFAMSAVRLKLKQYYEVGVKRYFDPHDTTDCSALRAPAILQTLTIRPIGLLVRVCAGHKVMRFHASMNA